MGKVSKKNIIRRNLILRALLEHGPLSLTELKTHTGISLPVAISLVSKLHEECLVNEIEQKITQVGRPPSVVELNNDAGFFLGIDIGRVNTNFVLNDFAQNIIVDIRKKSICLSNEISCIEALYEELDQILLDADVSWEKILGIGLSIPGIVQGPKGISLTYFNFGSRPLNEILSERFKKPVHIEHDMKAMTLGELWFGLAKNKKNVLCINMGWGISLGIIINGELYYGNNYFAGEFGHLQIVPDGNLCYCGKRGCLETYASGRAIAQDAKQRIKSGTSTTIRGKIGTFDEIDAKIIIEAANEGDQFSIELLEEAGRYMGYGIAQLINIFNPEMIILGGRLATAKSFITNSIKSEALKRSLIPLHDNLEIVISNLGPKAGALGVASLALRDFIEVEHLNPSAYV